MAKEVIRIPDLGGASDVEVVELSVTVGDQVDVDDVLIVLETDKASMEIPSPMAGRILSLELAEGDTVSDGDVLGQIETDEAMAQAEAEKPEAAAAEDSVAPGTDARQSAPEDAASGAAPVLEVRAPEAGGAREVEAIELSAPDASGAGSASGKVHAGPAVRKLAREFGVDLSNINGSGPGSRILKDDVQTYVKERLQQAPSPRGVSSGAGIPPIPEVDFSQFGPVRVEAMSKMHRITAENMHRSWLNVPRVTQFDEADISDLEQFRADLKPEAASRGLKLTPMPFLLKACALTLVNNPAFNVSLQSDGEQIIFKDYVHIGMAVATPGGLMVPVVRDVDKKSIYELAAESVELAAKAKERKLKPQDMQGGCFTISSLGGIGGTGFTPVVNAPEVAILGVSKLSVKPVWNGTDFAPRKMLPLALAYDHRAVNGADAGKFMTELVGLLSDIRRLAL